MQSEEQQSGISATFQVLILKVERKLYISQKLQSKTLDGIHKLLRLKKKNKTKKPIHIPYMKTVATMNIVWILN